MKKSVRIASGQGFWGDLPNAPIRQVQNGPIDYLVMDYLAEVTMSIMQKQKLRNSDHGYARDFVDVIEAILPDVAGQGIKIVSNAGGVNPHACKDAIIEVMRAQGYDQLKVAVVDGDDILPGIDQLIEDGHPLNNMETGEPVTSVKEQLLSANIYFGSRPIVQALNEGADIVITGRVTDTGLTLGPMIHEFDWSFEDYDKMASGTIAGHLIECGAQVSGGNFTDWEKVDDFSYIGFPIIEARADGTFDVTKHEDTGGLINEMTVKEQLLYEIGDPTEYITPDCIADFTSLTLKQEGPNRVRVQGIKGRAATDTYKVSASYRDGYKLSSTLVYSWPKALLKAQKAGHILRKRADDLDLAFDEFKVDYVGFNGTNEVTPRKRDFDAEHDEIQMRISVSGKDKNDLNRFGKEIAPLILTGPSGVTGFAGGRPKASDIVAYWPALLEKNAVHPQVHIFTTQSKLV